MNGQQALSAVMQPGGKLVSQEVAVDRAVRAAVPNAQCRGRTVAVEPDLPRTQHRAAGAGQGGDFRGPAGRLPRYDPVGVLRARTGGPAAGVRRVIEDELLTESGYRESLAEERVAKALAAAGAEPDALAKLVDRRLLRIEERSICAASSDPRCAVRRRAFQPQPAARARGARRAERQLAEQQERAPRLGARCARRAVSPWSLRA